MTNPLLLYSNFWNSGFYEYLKEINGDVLIYYYPRLGTFLKDIFSGIELKEKQFCNESTKKYIFQPFYFDNSTVLKFHTEKNINKTTTVYIIPPDVKILSIVASSIQKNKDNSSDEKQTNRSVYENRIIFFPRKTDECVSWLDNYNSQNNYIYVDKNFIEFDFLPIDEKVFLIPFVDFFYKVFEKQDFSLLQICSDVLTKIQFFYGKIPKVRIHGQKSKKVYDMFLEKSSIISNDKFPTERIFNNLIIIDRTTDLLTLLLPQTSYDGYIEESFTLDNGMISIPNDDLVSSTDLPITCLMSNKTQDLKEKEINLDTKNDQETEEKKSVRNELDNDIDREFEIKDYIHDYLKYRMVKHDIIYLNTLLGNIKSHRSRNRGSIASNHQDFSINGKIFNNSDINVLEKVSQSLLNLITSTANRINQFHSYKQLREELLNGLQLKFDSFTKSIQTFLYAEENALFAAQLIMAWCMIDGSLPKPIYEEFCDEIEFRYGSQASEQLHFLEKIQLITPDRTMNTYSKLNKVFNLEEHEKINQKVTADHQITSVDFSNKIKSDGYDGYVPLSVRIIQEDLETIPGSLTRVSDENLEKSENVNQKKVTANRNRRKLSYKDMLSSTVGSTFTSFTDCKPKGMKLFEKYFDEQYFCVNEKYVNSDYEINESETFSEENHFEEKTLVFFVGGVTQLELAWLNWLTERHFKGKSSIFVLTTGMMTAERFIKECLPCLREDHPSLKVMTDDMINLYKNGHY